MREIKFRAYCFRQKRMLYTDWGSFRNWYSESMGGKVVVERGYKYEKREMSDPMQFTGLMLNKKEVYQEDLIEAEYVQILHKWAGNTQKEVGREKMLLRVVEHNNSFELTNGFYSVWIHDIFQSETRSYSSQECIRRKDNFDKTYLFFENFEVVGNIYENNELLEAEG